MLSPQPLQLATFAPALLLRVEVECLQLPEMLPAAAEDTIGAVDKFWATEPIKFAALGFSLLSYKNRCHIHTLTERYQ